MAKMQHLVTQIKRFEDLLDADAPLEMVLPSIYHAYEERYRGYTIRRLCQEMHDFYKSRNVKQLQKEMFRKAHFPKMVMQPQEAHYEFLRGHVELIPLEEAEGRVAAEGALPYPPGVLCCVPGEVWGGSVLKYFLALEEGINRCPGFAPELQGVYIEQGEDGRKRAYGYVLKNK
jgi:ornithine decarboxylase